MPEATAYTTTQAHPVFSSLSAAATLDRQSREPSPEREDLNFPTLQELRNEVPFEAAGEFQLDQIATENEDDINVEVKKTVKPGRKKKYE